MNYIRILILAVLILFITFLISFPPAAGAQEIDRLPTLAEVAAGKLCVRSTAKGDYVAWYGDGPHPNVVACKRSACSLVGAKRSVAAFFSGPMTKQRLTEALAPYKEHPYTNQELRAVWVADFIANCQHIK